MHNKELVNLLINKGYKISVAESCTGGLFASKIIEISDASKVIDLSVVTYASDAKIRLLGVLPETIDKEHIVSEAVAIQMAKGVKNLANSQIGIGITGLAGPSGGSNERPIGMVCFGVAINDKTISFTKQFGDIGRNLVREKAVEYLIEALLVLL